MASINTLPNELLESVVGYLQDRKLDGFDPVGIQDLQSMRLINRRLHSAATPLLFESMVLDLMQWQGGDFDMRRIVTFAIKNPELAKLVHQLQLQVPPFVLGRALLDYHETEEMFEEEMTQHGWTSEQVALIHDMLVLPLQEWKRVQDDAFSFQHELANSGDALHPTCAAIRDTLRVLPNLRHVEHAVSTQWRVLSGKLEYNILEKTGLEVSCQRVVDISFNLSLIQGFKFILQNLDHPITSLKLRNISVCQLRLGRGQLFLPATLQHLDLDISDDIGWNGRWDPFEKSFVRIWRSNIASLVQLKTLRLEWGTSCRYVPSEPQYIDAFLVDPDNSTNISTFPHLKSLTLDNCSLRLCALLQLFNSHASTLQTLSLTRVTFDSSYFPASWSEIGTLCKDSLPRLTYLRLAKLTTHFPDAMTPERWNAGFEAATAYEWRRGSHGRDVERKGTRCPWEIQDIRVEQECKDKFNGDRNAFYREKERRFLA